jgi:endonuclease/exonuclease/phosphatase family metal-dependent hydrolase
MAFYFWRLLFCALTCTTINFSFGLRVISYNLNDKLRLKSKQRNIVKLLKELDGDILCLQEVNRKSEAARLAKELEMDWNHHAWHEGGMTVLSKTKILDWINIEIPDSYYNALVAIKTQNIWFCSVHLASTQYTIDDSERYGELSFIINEINKLNEENIIVAGDFNSLETSNVHDLMEHNGFNDTHKNRPWKKGTWMPAKNNEERIDRIYCKGDFFLSNGMVVDHNDIVWLKSIGWPTGNDHRLVLTDFIVKKR